jgi:hypothetical protein
MATVKNTLSRPGSAGTVLGAIKGSDTRSHQSNNLPSKRIKPQPYVPMGKGKR